MAKSIYMGVSGVARKVKQPYVGINGVARKVKSGYTGIGGVARQFLTGGLTIGSLTVGSTVKINIGGIAKEFIIVNHGIPSSNFSLYDNSANGTWLLMKDTYESRAWDSVPSNNNTYPNSEINIYLNGTFLNMFDAGVKNRIKNVRLPYSEDKTGFGNLSYTYAKCFLLSPDEVNERNVQFRQIGDILTYFRSSSPMYSIDYWLRLSYGAYDEDDREYFQYVFYLSSYNGTARTARTAVRKGVRPAIVLPFDTIINDTMTVIA